VLCSLKTGTFKERSKCKPREGIDPGLRAYVPYLLCSHFFGAFLVEINHKGGAMLWSRLLSRVGRGETLRD
jgi:hypothetical protein